MFVSVGVEYNDKTKGKINTCFRTIIDNGDDTWSDSMTKKTRVIYFIRYTNGQKTTRIDTWRYYLSTMTLLPGFLHK